MCVSKLCDDKWCVDKLCVSGRRRRAGEGRSAEPKTRTPHKDVGKYIEHNMYVYMHFFNDITDVGSNTKPPHTWGVCHCMATAGQIGE